MKKLFTAILAMGVLLINSKTVWGIPITLLINGQITSISGPGNGSQLDGSISVGTIFNGTYTFDSELSDFESANVAKGQYLENNNFLVGSLGNYILNVPFEISIWNNVGGNDRYGLSNNTRTVGSFSNTTDSYVTGLNRSLGWSINLEDYDASVFSSDALPSIPPPLSQFEHTSFSIVLDIDSNDDRTSLGGTITAIDLQPAPVPEPATLLLLGAMIIGIAGSQLRKKEASNQFKRGSEQGHAE